MRFVFVKKYSRKKNGKTEVVRGFLKRRRGRLSKPFYKVDKDSGCWVWLRGTNGKGYGVMSDDRGRRTYAHIYFYEKKYGRVPRGLELDHTCRKRFCVNPDHTEPVTHAVNCRRGSKAKLTYAQVLRIRKMRSSGNTFEHISKIFKISPSYALEVVSGKYWK